MKSGARTLHDEHVVAAINILNRAIEKLDDGGIDVRNYIEDAAHELRQTVDPFVGILGAHIVQIPTLAWEPTGPEDDDGVTDLTARLSGPQMVIGGLPMHLEARAVHDEDGTQVADGPWARDVDLLYEALEPNEKWQTVEINGRDYILVAFPHS